MPRRKLWRTTPRSCAICTDPIVGAPCMEPLGRDDALVPCCSSCAHDPAETQMGPERPYVISEQDSTHTRAMDAAYPGRRK